MIFIIGGTLAFFFEFLLLSKKNKSLADKILTFWMFMVGVHLFLYYFNFGGIDFKYPHLLGLLYPLPLVHGPLLFLYTSALTGYVQKWKAKYVLHFMPIFIFFIYYLRFFISTGQEKVVFIKQELEKPDLFFTFLFPAIVLSGFTYIVLTYFIYKKHCKNILNNLSNSNNKNNLHWIRNLIIGMLMVWLVVLVGDLIININIDGALIFISVVCFVVFMGYSGVRQGNIFVHQINTSNSNQNSEKEQLRYSKSGLREEQAIEIQQLLTELMEEKKLFQDENLSLTQLAELLKVHPNYLSQVINQRFKKNFYDFVNYYRIEEFKRLVATNKNKSLTLFALACDSGFNSKASFNNSFKKFTGTTPSEFVKSL